MSLNRGSQRGSLKPNVTASVNSSKSHGQMGQNLWFLSSKEARSTYVFLVVILHFCLLSTPFLNTAQAWTLTNVGHSAIMYYFLHFCKGSPFAQYDQGKYRRLTYWEQIDDGEQMTHTRKFFIIVPSILYILAQFYSKFDAVHGPANILAFAIAVVPKLPWFHKFRFMGINKY